jgi:hypothetical protein
MMMGAAEGNHELVADAATQRARLGKSQVVGHPMAGARTQGRATQLSPVPVASHLARDADDLPTERDPLAPCQGRVLAAGPRAVKV